MMETMIRTVIIDDDSHASSSLNKIIDENFNDLNLLGISENVKTGVKLINQIMPDLVFLDISLPDGTGFDILQHIEKRNFEVIFTTSHTDFAVKAFEFTALHYLLKPITIEKLELALNRYRHTRTFEEFNAKMSIANDLLANKPEKILLPTNGGLRVHQIKDIVRCESSANYTNVFFSNKEIVLVSKNLQNLDSMLSNYGFLRIHKSHLVNLDYLKEYYRGQKPYIIMEDGCIIPISASRREEISNILKNKYLMVKQLY